MPDNPDQPKGFHQPPVAASSSSGGSKYVRARARSVSQAAQAAHQQKNIAPRIRLDFVADSGEKIRLNLSLTSALWLRERIGAEAFEHWRKKKFPNLPEMLSEETAKILRARFEKEVAGDDE